MNTNRSEQGNRDHQFRYIFTRMIPTTVIVFFILFTFFPRFGNPISNLRGLGRPDMGLLSQQGVIPPSTLVAGLEQLQISGQLGTIIANSGTDTQTLGWNNTTQTLTISNGNSVELASLVASAANPQELTKTGNTLGLSGSATTIDLRSYLDNTDTQTLSRNGSILTISGGNSIDLAPLNTDAQTLSLSGSNLSVSGGNTIDITSINTDVLASLNCAVGQVSQWNGTAWVCASPAAVSDAQTLSLSGNNLSILNGNSVSLAGYLDNTDSQSLSLGGNTLSLVNGGSVNLAAYLDNTDVLAGLACSTAQIPRWNGTAWACGADAGLTAEIDGSVTNELQSLTWNAGTHILTISNGNTVDLGSLLDNTDAQSISKTGNTLSISGNSSTVDLASYLDNTDSQTLSRSGTTLTISGGNSIDLAPINTDSQDLSLTGTKLNISGGTGVDIASINTDLLASLSCSAGQIVKWVSGAWTCAADATGTDSQTLSLSSNSLSILNGNSVSLAAYLDNTDAQALSYSTGTHVLSISGNAGTIDLSGLLDNTDAQSISKTGNTLSISGNSSTVDLSSYLDNTDLLASLSCTSGQMVQWNGTAWVCITPSVGTDSQNLSLSSNILSISNGNTVSLSAYLDNTDSQAISLASNILSISGSTDTIDLSPYLDNTDSQKVSFNTGTHILSISGGNTADLSSLMDNTDSQTLSWNSTTSVLTIADGNTVNLGSLLDNTDAQSISKTGNTLSISGNTSTVDLSAYLDNTDILASLSCAAGQLAKWVSSAWTCSSDSDNQAISKTGNTLSITGNAGTVDLSAYLDNTDAQAISKAGNIISISGNAGTVDLSAYLDNTDSQSLSLGDNTLSLVNGGSVNLAAYLDNTDVLASLACSANQIPKFISGAWACAADAGLTSEVDGSTTNELQSLSWNGGTHILTISLGNTVDLGSLLDNTDAQAISKTGNTLSISGNASTVDLASYLDNTDSQTLSRSGTTLTISGGNSIDLAPINTDNQNLSLSGTTLNISGGTGVNIASINTDVLAGLSCTANQIAKWNGSAWACAADVDTNTDAQTLSLSSNNLSILNGNSISLASYLDNTDAQALSYNTGTHVLSISGSASTIDLSGLLDNTDSQAISKSGNTLSISGNAATVDLSSYLDNTDVLASLSCTANQVAKWVSSAWTCAGDSDGQTISRTGNTISITGSAGTVDLSPYMDNTDSQAISLASNVLSISGSAGTVNLASYLDNTDAQALSYNTGTHVLSISGNANTIDLSALLDNTDSQSISKTGNTLSISGNDSTVDLSGYLDNTDALASLSCLSNQLAKWNGTAWACAADSDSQAISKTGNTLSITGNAGTVDLSGYLDNTDAQAISLASNVLSISGNAGTVNLAAYLDNTDSQALSYNTGTHVLSISGNAGTIDLSSLNTDVLAGLSCSNNQIAKWNGSAWTCAADAGLTSEGDGVIGNEVTDATASGGLTRSGSGTAGAPYTLGIGTAGVTNAMLANSGVTVTAGTGLSGGGAVSLGGTVTLTSTLGTDITSGEIVDGTIATADIATGAITSGLIFDGTIATADIATSAITTGLILDKTILFADIASNSCSTNQIMKYDGTNWSCGADNGLTVESDGIIGNEVTDVTVGGVLTRSGSGTAGSPYTLDVTANGLDFAQFKDAMTLDAATTIALGNFNYTVNVNGTGAFVIQDSGVTAFTVTSTGNVNIGDPSSAIATGSLLVLDNITADPTGTNGAMYYNSSTNKFRCFQNSNWVDCTNGDGLIKKLANQTATTSSTTFQNVTDLTLPLATNTNYSFDITLIVNVTDATTADLKYTLTAPTGATLSAMGITTTGTTGASLCTLTSVTGTSCSVATTSNTRIVVRITGLVSSATTAGNLQVQFAQNASSTTASPVILANSTLRYTKL